MNPNSMRFPDSIKKLHRLLEILRMFDKREKVTLEILAERFGTCIRTADRDIKDIVSSGFPIIKENKTYRANLSLRKLDLSDKEITTLLFSEQFACKLGKPFKADFLSLLAKVYINAEAGTRARFKRLLNQKQKLFVAIDPVNDFEKIEKQYQIIIRAMDENQKLEITYHGMKSQRESTRQVAPYGLFYGAGMWYMVGRCYREGGIRTFALDRIKNIELTGNSYFVPDNFNIESYM